MENVFVRWLFLEIFIVNLNTTCKKKQKDCNCYLCHKIVCRLLYNQKTLDKSFISFSYIDERQAQEKRERERESVLFEFKDGKFREYVQKKTEKKRLWKHRCKCGGNG